MGFAFPKQESAALVAGRPDKFLMPLPRDERYNWVRVRLDAIDETELTELIVEAWRMVVPKRVAAAHLGDRHTASVAPDLPCDPGEVATEYRRSVGRAESAIGECRVQTG